MLLRGYIIDIFPIESEHPIRLEFFGDEIDSIRFFNEETQLSINEVSSFKLMPFSEVSTEQHNSLYEYMNKPFTFFVDENQILNGYNKILEDIKDYNESKNTDDVFMYKYEEIMVDNFMRVETVNNYADSISYNSKPMIKI